VFEIFKSGTNKNRFKIIKYQKKFNLLFRLLGMNTYGMILEPQIGKGKVSKYVICNKKLDKFIEVGKIIGLSTGKKYSILENNFIFDYKK